MSGEQIDVTPEPTPEEREAIRRALSSAGEPGAGRRRIRAAGTAPRAWRRAGVERYLTP